MQAILSVYLFNLQKCDLTPTKKLTYFWVTIDLTNKTKSFVTKVTKEFIKERKYNLTKRYKQRLAELLNFEITILKLPTQMIHLAYFHHRKLYKFVDFIHPRAMSYQAFVNDLPIYTDATHKQIGIISPYDTRLAALKSKQHILENEYL